MTALFLCVAPINPHSFTPYYLWLAYSLQSIRNNIKNSSLPPSLFPKTAHKHENSHTHKHTDITDPHSPPDRCASHTTTPSPAATSSSPASPTAPRNSAAKSRSTARAPERRTWARRWCCGAGGAGVWGSNEKRGDGTGTHGVIVVELWGCAEMCTGLRTISV